MVKTTVLDLDRSILTEITTVEIVEGVTVQYHYDEGATQPNEVVLTVGTFEVEMAYSAEVQQAIDSIADINAIDFLKTPQNIRAVRISSTCVNFS